MFCDANNRIFVFQNLLFYLVDAFKDFIIFNVIQIDFYCNFKFRYKTNEKKYEGYLNTRLNNV